MKIDEIKLLFEYNYWADQRILAACGNISHEQFVAANDYGNLRDILIHILDSVRAWRVAFQMYFVAPGSGTESALIEPKFWDRDHNSLTEADLPTLEALKEHWQTEERQMRAYISSRSDQDLNGLVRYLIPDAIVRERVLWHCLLHIVNHGAQHRSEAAVLLTGYRQSPGGLDLTGFLNEHFNLPS